MIIKIKIIIRNFEKDGKISYEFSVMHGSNWRMNDIRFVSVHGKENETKKHRNGVVRRNLFVEPMAGVLRRF